MKKLVTVTCTRDLNQMVLQSHSIDKFVTNPCEHHIYIQDLTTPEDYWYKILSPFYTKHCFKLYFKGLENYKYHGWYHQQILKLEAVNDVNDDYLILDSKNFFIKPTALNYDISEGSYLLLDRKDWTDDFVTFLKNEYGLFCPNYYYTQQTPFKFRQSVVKNLLKSIDVNHMFNKCADLKIYPSEFVLYMIYSDMRPTPTDWARYQSNTIYHTWWWNHQLVPNEFEKIYNSSVEILGIHKNVWYHKNPKIKYLANWIIEKGLDTRYVMPATVCMDWGDTYLQDETSPAL